MFLKFNGVFNGFCFQLINAELNDIWNFFCLNFVALDERINMLMHRNVPLVFQPERIFTGVPELANLANDER